MAIKQREDEGLPEYFATFADMMTLLMTFFVLLFSMSTLDPVKIADMMAAMEENLTGEARASREPVKNQGQIYREVLESITQSEMEDYAQVTHGPKGTSITIDAQFAFDVGSAELMPAIFPVLDMLVPIMMDRGNRYPIAVEGHTDNLRPTGEIAARYPTNWELSAARAASVVNYLIDQGVPRGKLRAVGFADTVPKDTDWSLTRTATGVSEEMISAANSTDELQTQNRRVEITFLSVG